MKTGNKLVKKGIDRRKVHQFNHAKNAPQINNQSDNKRSNLNSDRCVANEKVASRFNHISRLSDNQGNKHDGDCDNKRISNSAKEVNIVKQMKQELKQKKLKQSTTYKQQSSINPNQSLVSPKQPTIATQSNIQFKTILKQAHELRKIKSDDKFSNYKSLITNYQQNHKTSYQKLPQSNLKQLIKNNNQQQQIELIKQLNSPQIIKNQNKIDYSNNTNIKQANHVSINTQDLLSKQREIQMKYINLQQKYKHILITTKDHINLYEQQKQKLISLKAQHFHHQNLLESLRSQYFAKNISLQQNPSMNSLKMLSHHNHNTVDYAVQTDCFDQQNIIEFNSKPQSIDDQLSRNLIIKAHNKNFQSNKKQIQINKRPQNHQFQHKSKLQQQKKYKTQNNWFISNTKSSVYQSKLSKSPNFHQPQDKRHSTNSQKYLNSHIFGQDQKQTLVTDLQKRLLRQQKVRDKTKQDKEQKIKSRTSIKRKKNSLLSSQSVKNTHQNNHQLIYYDQQPLKKMIKQSSIDKQTPRLNQYKENSEYEQENPAFSKFQHQSVLVQESNIKKDKYGYFKPNGRTTKKGLTDDKKTKTQVKDQNLKGSRLSQKSIKSVKRDLFGTKNSQYLNQFRKQIKKQSKVKKYEQYLSEDQFKETFGSKEISDIKDKKPQVTNLTKSRRKDKNFNHVIGNQQNKASLGRENEERKIDGLFRKGNRMKSSGIEWDAEEIRAKEKMRQENDEQQRLIAPQTPVYKFYQKTKPIQPSQTLSKYRFKPSIKIH